MKYKGIIFDFNGTLLWDSHLHEKAWRDFAKKTSDKIISDEEFFNHLHGRVNFDILTYILGRNPDNNELVKYTDEKEEIYRDLCKKSNMSLAPGAINLLNFLNDKNIPHTIATASEKNNVSFFIKEFALDKYFNTKDIIFDDNTFPGKPAPDIYLKAAEKIGLTPDECIVIEDALSGIKSAANAGIGKIIAIGTKENYDSLNKLAEIKDIITDFNDFDRQILIRG